MKLPEFKSTTSASMQSAMMTPQLRPMTIANRAPQHNVMAGQLSRQDAERNAMAKYDVGIALAEGFGSTIKVFTAIDEGDQKMASAAGAGEYSRRMSDFHADELANAEEIIDPSTDTRRWEEYDERYKAESEKVMADVRSRYKFSGKVHEYNFSQKVLGADQTYTTNLQSQSNKSKINRGEANFYREVNGTGGTQAKIELAKTAFDSGYITEYKRDKLVYDFRSKDIYDAYGASVERQNNAGLLNIINDVEDGTSSTSSRLTTAQRNEVASDARRQIKSNHLAAMDTRYDTGGTMAVADYIQSVSNAGPDGSYTEDEVGHASLIGSLTAKLNQYEAVERGVAVEQQKVSETNMLFGTLNDQQAAEANVYYDSKKRGIVDKEISPVVAQMPNDVFFSPEREQHIPFNNMLKAGFVPKSIKTKLEFALNNPTNPELVKQAAEMVRDIDMAFPQAAEYLSGDAITKAYYMVDAERNGMPLLDDDGKGAINDYETIRKYTPDQKREMRDRSSAYLAENPDLVDDLARKLGATDTDFLSPDVPVASPLFNQRVSAGFHHYYQVTNNPTVAAELAVSNAMKSIGATTRYGTSEPVWEENSPEALLPVPGNQRGTPNEWINQQFDEQLAELNMLRGEANMPELDNSEVRLEHSKDYTWAIVTPDGEYVSNGTSRAGMRFLPTNPELQIEHESTVHNNQVSQSNAVVQSRVASASVELAPVKYGAVPNATVQQQSATNQNIWNMTSDKEKRAENINYNLAKDQLKAIGIDDLSIKYYLNASGYLHGDSNNNYIGVPDAVSQP